MEAEDDGEYDSDLSFSSNEEASNDDDDQPRDVTHPQYRDDDRLRLLSPLHKERYLSARLLHQQQFAPTARDLIDDEEFLRRKCAVDLYTDTYLSHKQWIEALRCHEGVFSRRLEEARLNMRKLFPLDTNEWELWLEDSKLNLMLSPSPEMWQDSFQQMHSLFGEAVNDYRGSVHLWTKFLLFLQLFFNDEHDVKPLITIDLIRSVYGDGLAAIGLDLSHADQFWDQVINFEINIFQALSSLTLVNPPTDSSQLNNQQTGVEEQRERVRTLILRRLYIPLKQLSATHKALREWDTSFPSQKDTASAGGLSARSSDQIFQTSSNLLKVRIHWEQKIKCWNTQPSEVDQNNPDWDTLPAWNEYIAWEAATSGDTTRIVQLFERAILHLPICASLWEEFCHYLLVHCSRVKDLLIRVHQNAVRNCPWSHRLWLFFLQLPIRFPESVAKRIEPQETSTLDLVQLCTQAFSSKKLFHSIHHQILLFRSLLDIYRFLPSSILFDAAGEESAVQDEGDGAEAEHHLFLPSLSEDGDTVESVVAKMQKQSRKKTKKKRSKRQSPLPLLDQLLLSNSDPLPSSQTILISAYQAAISLIKSSGFGVEQAAPHVLELTCECTLLLFLSSPTSSSSSSNVWTFLEDSFSFFSSISPQYLITAQLRLFSLLLPLVAFAVDHREKFQLMSRRCLKRIVLDQHTPPTDFLTKQSAADLWLQIERSFGTADSLLDTLVGLEQPLRTIELETIQQQQLQLQLQHQYQEEQQQAETGGEIPTLRKRKTPPVSSSSSLEVGQPPQKIQKVDTPRIFITNLPPQVNETIVREEFQSIGPIKALVLPKRDNKTENKGYCFIEYESSEQSQAAVLQMDKILFHGNKIRVKPREEPLPQKTPVWFDDQNTLFVSNLGYDLTESFLTDLFNKYGRVVSVRLIKSRQSGRSNGYGYVQMASESDLKAASVLNETQLEGRTIKVLKSNPPKGRASGSTSEANQFSQPPSRTKKVASSKQPRSRLETIVPPLKHAKGSDEMSEMASTGAAEKVQIVATDKLQMSNQKTRDLTPKSNDDFRKMLFGSSK